jgi:hypothetical protein
LLCGVVLGLGFIRIRPEVKLVGGVRVEAGEGVGVRVVAGDGVGVRVVLGYNLLASQCVVGAFAWALSTLRGPRAKRSRSGESACDVSVADSHTIAHGDVEFELEADPSSKSACWL